MFFRSFFKNKDLRKKIFYTISLLFLFRFLSYIPVPWVDAMKLRSLLDNPVLEMAGIFSGGALSSFTLMATGISSYITASIVIQLLTYSIPKLYEISKSPNADEVIKKITSILGVILSIITSLGLTLMFDRMFGFLIVSEPYVFISIALIHALGTMIAINIGESITDKGIGNGVSLLIFVNVVSELPRKVLDLVNNPLFTEQQKLLFFGTIFVMVLMIVILELSEKRINVRYAKNMLSDVGINKNTYIPLKLNVNGVMPIIFSTTIIQTLVVVSEFISNPTFDKIMRTIGPGTPVYPIVTTILIFLFSFFYSSLVFNPKDIAENLQLNGGLIGDIRPGRATARYIQREGREVTLINSMFLAALSLLPVVVLTKMGFPMVGATTIMIVISVAIELYSDISIEVSLTSNTLKIEDILE